MFYSLSASSGNNRGVKLRPIAEQGSTPTNANALYYCLPTSRQAS